MHFLKSTVLSISLFAITLAIFTDASEANEKNIAVISVFSDRINLIYQGHTMFGNKAAVADVPYWEFNNRYKDVVKKTLLKFNDVVIKEVVHDSWQWEYGDFKEESGFLSSNTLSDQSLYRLVKYGKNYGLSHIILILPTRSPNLVIGGSSIDTNNYGLFYSPKANPSANVYVASKIYVIDVNDSELESRYIAGYKAIEIPRKYSSQEIEEINKILEGYLKDFNKLPSYKKAISGHIFSAEEKEAFSEEFIEHLDDINSEDDDETIEDFRALVENENHHSIEDFHSLNRQDRDHIGDLLIAIVKDNLEKQLERMLDQ